MAILTLEQVKTALRLQQTADDTFLQMLIDSISIQVERYTAKRFEPTPAFDGSGNDTGSPVTQVVEVDFTPAALAPLANPGGVASVWPRVTLGAPVSVTIPHCRQITAVLWGSTAIDATQYAVRYDRTLRDPFIRRLLVTDPALGIVDTLSVTGRFGITPVPADIMLACLFMVSRQQMERTAQFADAVQMPDGSVSNYFRQYPPWVKATFDGYCELGS